MLCCADNFVIIIEGLRHRLSISSVRQWIRSNPTGVPVNVNGTNFCMYLSLEMSEDTLRRTALFSLTVQTWCGYIPPFSQGFSSVYLLTTTGDAKMMFDWCLMEDVWSCLVLLSLSLILSTTPSVCMPWTSTFVLMQH